MEQLSQEVAEQQQRYNKALKALKRDFENKIRIKEEKIKEISQKSEQEKIKQEVSKLKLLHQKSIKAITAMNEQKIAEIKKQASTSKQNLNQLVQQQREEIDSLLNKLAPYQEFKSQVVQLQKMQRFIDPLIKNNSYFTNPGKSIYVN